MINWNIDLRIDWTLYVLKTSLFIAFQIYNEVKASIESKPDLLGDHSVAVPPDSIPNSVVKRNNADGSVGLPHVRVGHRQAPN